MTSIQENLARVRRGLESYSTTSDSTSSERVHSDILSAHASAFQEHERSLGTERRREKDDNRARKRPQEDTEGRGRRSMRFRFKNTSDDVRKRRKHRSKKSSSRNGGEEGHDTEEEGVERFTAHPLRRPAEAGEWLSDTPNNDGGGEGDPDLAFRESLFDALADDEGAAVYWEHVYSQPVHIYTRPSITTENGTLEAMNDEEYAIYVKRKMWERLHPEEAREIQARQQRQEQREKKKEKREKPGRERKVEVEEEVQAALDRGTARKWTNKWRAYQGRWSDVDAGKETDGFPWPTESLSRTGRNVADEARVFLEGVVKYALPAMVEKDEELEAAKRVMLKAERFRWHPDKMTQRFGSRVVQWGEMEDVTAVWQVVDEMLAAVGK